MVTGAAQVDIIDDPLEIARVRSPAGKPFLRVRLLDAKITVDLTLNLAEMIGGAARGAQIRYGLREEP